MVEIRDCKRGDIIKIRNTIVVLVDNGCEEGFIFTALPNSYIAVESGENVVYGYGNSGWENVSKNTLVKKIGHIELYYAEQNFSD